MALGRRREQQRPMFVVADELPKSAGHPFYGKLHRLLAEADFDRWVEEQCRPYYAEVMGRPSIPPGVFFRMMLVGFFEGIESLRQIAWRCSDSLAIREFLGLALTQRAPDDTSLTVIRQRFPLELFEEVFRFMIRVARKKKLLKGHTIAVDATTLEASAAMKSIVSRAEGKRWPRYVRELAAKEGVARASAEEARRFDAKRDKKVSNQDWMSPTDPDSRIVKMKDGRTHLAYKAEHAIDLDSEILVAASVHPADRSDAQTLPDSLVRAQANLEQAETGLVIAEVVADKGYHAGGMLAWCTRMGVRTYVPERKDRHRRRWRDKPNDWREAVYANRRRVARAKGRRLQRKRSERVERSFAFTCESGGVRRMTIRGLDEVNKRWLMQTAAYNLGVLMRKLFGVGTPREWSALPTAILARLVLAMTAMMHRIAAVLHLDCNLVRSRRTAADAVKSAEITTSSAGC